MRGRNAEGIRPSDIEAREGENRGVNLPPLLAAHLGRNESGQPLRSSLNSVQGGHQPSINMEGNLPPNGTLLSHHAQPFVPSSLHTPTGLVPIHVNPYSQPSTGLAFTNNGVPSYNGPMYPTVTLSSNYPFYTQPMYEPPNIPVYPNPAGSFVDSIGSVTPFIRWIKEYPLPDGLKMPSHIGSYDGKGDPDNFLHLFEWAIHMQKWLMLIACHMFTYILKDSACIWWNSQKTCSILNYEDLKAKFRSHFSQQKKFTKTHLAIHNIKQRESESTRAFVTRYTIDTLQILGLHEEQRIFGFVHGLRTRSLVEHLSIDLPSTYKGLIEITYTRSNQEKWQPMELLMIEGKTLKGRRGPLRTITEDRRAGIDHGHETNDCLQLRNQIEEAVKSGQLSHLVKGIKKEKVKAFENQRTEEKKDKSTTPAEAPILMIRQDESASKIDSKVPLVGFSGGKSWSIGKIPLEITIGRTTMQRIGIIVSTIHGAIKFHTAEGIGTVFSTHESDKVKEGVKKVRETSPAIEK
ncbi:reverse transcriptase domain-containing protein [Tanacetum coccineum]